MEDLPELPFEKVLSYLNLEDVIRSRTVSRGWYKKFNSIRVNSLFYSDRPIGFIYEKNRMASSFAHFSSSKFESFVNISRQPILSNLKRLRLYGLQISNKISAFVQTLESFGQLEELGIFHFFVPYFGRKPRNLKLSLPMLHSIQIEHVQLIKRLTLKASRLKRIQIRDCSTLELCVVPEESAVEMLVIDHLVCSPIKKWNKLKNLKILYIKHISREFNSTLLSDLPQLKEIHIGLDDKVLEFFEQKQRFDRVDLKIFYCGCPLDDLDDWKRMSRFNEFSLYTAPAFFDYLAENISKLADEIPFFSVLPYSAIEGIAPELAINILKRFTELDKIRVTQVRDVEHFLAVLKQLNSVVELMFLGDQPQDLFDRLPEHCAVQDLWIDNAPSDLRFLSRLKHLLTLQLDYSIDARSIRTALQVLKEPKFLSKFTFKYNSFHVQIEISPAKLFQITARGQKADVLNVNDAVRFIVETLESRVI